MNALNRLDRRVLPRLARGLRRIESVTRGRRVNPLTALAAILVAAVIAAIVWPLTRTNRGDAGVRSTMTVGVTDGDSIPGYIDASRTELDRLAKATTQQPTYALVTFATYLPPSRVAEIAASAPDGVITIAAYARVPVPRRQTELVRLAAGRLPDDLIASMIEVAGEKEGDAAAHRERARSEVGADARAMYEALASLEEAEARAYRGACACVFALVVRGAPADLVGLAGNDAIRVIDAAPGLVRLDRAVFKPPLPEQLDVAAPPPDDGLDSPRRPAPLAWPVGSK